jgi:hypothetical protein
MIYRVFHFYWFHLNRNNINKNVSDSVSVVILHPGDTYLLLKYCITVTCRDHYFKYFSYFDGN